MYRSNKSPIAKQIQSCNLKLIHMPLAEGATIGIYVIKNTIFRQSVIDNSTYFGKWHVMM